MVLGALALLLILAQPAVGQHPSSGEDLPDWLRSSLARVQQGAHPAAPLYVAVYVFREDTTYYVPPTCCDVRSVLFDSSGHVVCRPDGGIMGRGDGRCPDFFALAERIRTVWSPFRVPRVDTVGARPLEHISLNSEDR